MPNHTGGTPPNPGMHPPAESALAAGDAHGVGPI